MQTKLTTIPQEMIDFVTPRLDAQYWQFAKTYALKAPHHYFIDKWNFELFKAMVHLIDKYGVEETFAIGNSKKVFRYFYLGEYKYWRDEMVMNRVHISKVKKGKDGVWRSVL